MPALRAAMCLHAFILTINCRFIQRILYHVRMTPPEYLTSLNKRLATGRAREHAYRGDLEKLLETILPDDFRVINEPSQVTGVGNPDFLIRNQNGVAVGYIEAKDVGKDIDHRDYQEQFNRYRRGLDNLIITDYLRFDFYQNGELIHTVSIGELGNGLIKPGGGEYDRFVNLIRDFGTYQGEPIRSPKRLAELMAGKARLLQDILHRALVADIDVDNDTDLKGQYDTFRDILLHDLEPKQFSDLYAQTLAYGLFAARLHDDSLDNFSRQEAGELIPRSNPFLRQLFGFVAGNNIDSRILATVDNLADIFLLADVRNLMTDYGRATAQTDPVVHFYETFLAEYDPKLRKQRGVWYTPQPVVDFIVRAVDDLLKSEFNLKDGLADSTKIKTKKKVVTKKTADRRSKVREVEIEQETHRVQILDPATGTGTFLATAVNYIFDRSFKNKMEGAWPEYVEQHLIPRLNGFELLMASYAMAHLKLDLTLRETGYVRELGQRFQVYLTNSLEEDHPDTGTLFASFLSNEANEANAIKRDTPVMVVMGNPPYSGLSTNKGTWITDLIDDYKYVDGKHFGERKHWLNDDYVKFIRMAEHLVNKTGEGIVAYINNHSFLDNPTFRGMRYHLMKSFDNIYVIDLHGNSLKKETTPDGERDVNVFDIQAGVSINILIKRQTGNKDLANVYHAELYGQREAKYTWLKNSSFHLVGFAHLNVQGPFYQFIPRSFDQKDSYDSGFKLTDLFLVSGVGFVSANDTLNISFTEEEHQNKMQDLKTMSEADWRISYNRPNDAQSWKYRWAKLDYESHQNQPVERVLYRPFDVRYTLYTGQSGGLFARPSNDALKHLRYRKNVALVTPKINKEKSGTFVTNIPAGHKTYSAYDSNTIFPLYVLDESFTASQSEAKEFDFHDSTRSKWACNMNKGVVGKIASKLMLQFVEDGTGKDLSFTPTDIFDYIYAVLHDTHYCEVYEEFLKVDYPRIPYPNNPEQFKELAHLGRELREIHLLEHPVVDDPMVKYVGQGDNAVTRKLTQGSPGWVDGAVWINDTQSFTNVPYNTWVFYVGGYQPAQKWLKDRRGRKLSYDDIRHYLRIIRALTETERLMAELRGMTLEA